MEKPASEPVLGRPRAQVRVTIGPDRLLVEIPVRRTRATWLLGVLLLGIGVPLTVFHLAVLVWSIVIVTGGPGAALSLPVIAVLVLFTLLEGGVFMMAAAAGAFTLFGTQTVSLADTELRLQWRVGHLGGPSHTVRLDDPVAVEVREGRRGRSLVHVQSREGGFGREASFGSGKLSRRQAEGVAQSIRDWLGGLSNQGMEQTASR